jgi:menaquinone-9 beta-reductase
MNVDVAIVGAGPAGSSTALHLLQLMPRARIAIFERTRLPREKPCGGAISRWGLNALDNIDATPAALAVPHVPVAAVRVRHGAHVNEHREDEPLGVVVERAIFDAALAREAERRGATLHEEHRLVALEDRTLVFDNGARVHAGAIVGADGTGSAVRRLAGFDENGPRARLIVVETDAAADEDIDGGVLEFDLSCVDRGIDGYVWHFTTTFGGKRCVSRGIFDWRGRRKGDGKELRTALVDALRARGVATDKVRFKPYSERVFATDGPVASRSVVLCGEAAALVDPITGEGIAQAVVSGKLAAAELCHGSIDPARYAKSLASLRCYRHLRQSAALAPHVYGERASLWASALARTRAAVDAGADWYVGRELGTRRKVEVGASFGWSLVRAALSSALSSAEPGDRL